jgi:hypothetical protein
VRTYDTLIAEVVWKEIIAICPFLKDHRWVLQASSCT